MIRCPSAARATHALALALLAGTLAACPESGPKRPPSVLLITVDTLRADRLGCYGYERPTTPELDRWAQSSVLFERAYSQAPFTAPAHASLFTGVHTPTHGVLYWGRKLADEVPTFAERFSSGGWRTAAFYNHPTMASCDLERGFAKVEKRFFEPAEDTLSSFLEWQKESDRPYAAWIHLWDVHRPYAYRDWSGEPLREHVQREQLEFAFEETRFGEATELAIGRTEAFYNLDADERRASFPLPAGARPLTEADWQFVEDRYDSGVWYADRALGRLLDELERRGELEHTIVLITSDHGESFTEREPCWFTHDPFLYEEVLRVPLLLRLPGGAEGGRRVSSLARGIDVLPTLLEAAGQRPHRTIHGRSLLSVARGETPTRGLMLYAQTQTRSAKESARSLGPNESGWLEQRELLFDGRYKLIHDRESGKRALFDLETDPGEMRDRAADPALAEQLERLQTELDKHRLLPRAGESEAELDPATRAQLKALGYLDDSGDDG